MINDIKEALAAISPTPWIYKEPADVLDANYDIIAEFEIVDDGYLIAHAPEWLAALV